MYDHTRRLVDDDESGILIHHVEGDGLAPGQGRGCPGYGQVERLAWFDPIRGVGYGRAARYDPAILD